MARLSSFTERNLNNQGFGNLNTEAKTRYALPLRFTPGLGTALIVIGLGFRSPIWLGSMAAVAFTGALLPSGMLIDLIYNKLVRHLFHAPPLPPTPRPRQFSYLLSTVLLAGSAASFYYRIPALGFILAGMVVIGGTILTTTLWCLGSWNYRLLFGRAAVNRGSDLRGSATPAARPDPSRPPPRNPWRNPTSTTSAES
jgi:hypothetical protein